MARRKNKRSKRVPAHRFLYYALAHTGDGEDFHYIDLARHLSMVNRRLYRQGMVYHIANVTVHDTQGDAQVRFNTAPDTWGMRTGYRRFFEAWKAQRRDVLESNPGIETGKWSDFKVYLNLDHVTDTDWPSPSNTEAAAIAVGTWDYADIAFAKDGTAYDNHSIGLLGAHDLGSSISSETTADDSSYDGYISIIEGFQEVYSQPTSPTIDDTGFTSSVLVGMTPKQEPLIMDDVLAEIADEGDNAPYNSVFVGASGNAASAPFTIRETHLASAAGVISAVGGFPVPCGLLQVETESGQDNTIGILIEVAPGPYKGILAEKM